MLTVQSVNLMKQPAFSSYHSKYGEVTDVDFTEVKDSPEMSDDISEDVFYYSKEDYEKDKSALERQLYEINDVIENTEVPKPVRAVGKLASIGLGAALGFVGLKYGTQGVVEFGKKGFALAKSLGDKKFVKNIVERSRQLAVQLKESKIAGKTTAFFDNLGNKYSESNLGKKLNTMKNFLHENELTKSLVAKGKRFKENIAKYVTGKNIEKGAVNLFAVSGGVTGGVTALQEVTKD